MADYQVNCVTKRPNENSLESITHLGGNGWWWTRQRIIKAVQNKTDTFFTFVDLNRAEVGVAPGPEGLYLRTHIDGVWNDDLLKLDPCGQRNMPEGR